MPKHAMALTELGRASFLTRGYYRPEHVEAFIFLDYFDMP